MKNNNNNFNNSINFNNKRKDMIDMNKYTGVFVALPMTKDGQTYIGSGMGIMSTWNPKLSFILEKSVRYTPINNVIESIVNATLVLVTKQIQKMINSKKHLRLVFAINSVAVAEYHAAYKGFNKNNNMSKALIRLLNVAKEYYNLTGIPVVINSYMDYHYESLIVSEEAEKQLIDDMELVFKGNNCVNVLGVSFLSKWHTHSCKRKLRIFYKNVFDTEGQVNKNVKRGVIRISKKYTVHQPCNNEGILQNQQGAFVTKLWRFILDNFPGDPGNVPPTGGAAMGVMPVIEEQKYYVKKLYMF